MSEGEGAGQGNTGDGGNANEGREGTQQQETNNQENTDQLPEWAQRTINSLREAERRFKRENSTLSNKVSQLESATLSDQEKTQNELKRLQGVESEYQTFKRERLMREAFIEAAREAGATKPEAAFRLAEGFDVDNDGNITNLKNVLAKVKTDYPEFFAGNGSADGGAGRQQSVMGVTFDEIIRKSRG